MLTSSDTDAHNDAVEPPLDRAGLEWLQDQVTQVQVAESVAGYIVDLGRACRRRLGAAHGPSPRALLAWQRVSRAWAFLEGRGHVLPDDVQLMASPVLGVRLGLAAEQLQKTLDGVLADVAVPVMP
jgi:MoxR-like ATPase